MRRLCREETERDPWAKAKDLVRAKEKVEDGAQGAGQAPEETAFAPDVGKGSPMKREIRATTRSARNAERP